MSHRRGVWHTPGIEWIRQLSGDAADAVRAVAYKTNAIRPCKRRKNNNTKITFDAGKTMSHVEKITSDIIQTTSDLFSPLSNL